MISSRFLWVEPIDTNSVTFFSTKFSLLHTFSYSRYFVNLFRSSVSFSEIFMKDFWAFTKTQIKRKKIDIIFFMFRLEVTFLQLPLTKRGLAKFPLKACFPEGILPIRRCVEGFCDSENALTQLRM